MAICVWAVTLRAVVSSREQRVWNRKITVNLSPLRVANDENDGKVDMKEGGAVPCGEKKNANM